MLKYVASGKRAHGSIAKTIFLPLLCIATLGISACDYSNPKPKKFTEIPFDKKVADASNLAKPAAIDDGLSVNGISIVKERGTPQKAREGMASLKGLKTETLFTNKTQNNDERFARLEQAVQKLSSKLDTMSPAVIRLTEIDRDLEKITNQLEILVKDNSANKTTPPKYREAKINPAYNRKPAPNKTASNKIAANKTAHNKTAKSLNNILPASGGASDTPKNISSNIIKNIRIGDHVGKTRIVFETSQKPDISILIDDIEDMMSASVDNASVKFNTAKLGATSGLINAVQSSSDDKTATLIFDLSKNTKKIGQGYIPPNSKNANHRVFIDLKK